MAAMLQSPISSTFAHTAIHDAVSKSHMTHLSGATMNEVMGASEPSVHLVTNFNPAFSRRSSAINMQSNRVSVASTTKSQLRQSNQILVEMLQSIQSELAAHRTIMLDIQHRVSKVEQNHYVGPPNQHQLSRFYQIEDHRSRRSSRLLPETREWWQACQNFAKNCDPPMSAREFLRSPTPLSAFDWPYNPSTAHSKDNLESTPEVDDVPPLTPTSEDGDADTTEIDTPKLQRAQQTRLQRIPSDDVKIGLVRTTTPKTTTPDTVSDIKEQTVTLDKGKNLPPPPPLQAAPKAASIRSINSHRVFKGVKSLATWRVGLRNKNHDKEHTVLIHFHRRGEVEA
ncbi:hypothetical protein P154DRAFT_521225 [Amniculicola lignicola CBS 123094]|uniref:Uncharacterized protein n=1 Tax=Amniculicola lignicola CBS 123094 TaxID=1392246 RepID=A0A6A5WKR5_9PLEO|nr:hypothetical protein P154DRAFT_521225 [Amniculicola lignicola CBS 123094]